MIALEKGGRRRRKTGREYISFLQICMCAKKEKYLESIVEMDEWMDR